MTADGFGIEHQPDCPQPQWRTARPRNGGDHQQQCRNCGIRWEGTNADHARAEAQQRHGIPPALLPGQTPEEVQDRADALLTFANARTGHLEKKKDTWAPTASTMPRPIPNSSSVSTLNGYSVAETESRSVTTWTPKTP